MIVSDIHISSFKLTNARPVRLQLSFFHPWKAACNSTSSSKESNILSIIFNLLLTPSFRMFAILVSAFVGVYANITSVGNKKNES
ncbi:hypothetical protein M758_7G139300 [Ceratodon purpureus]|uniref:Uncharacterized protein n=1 Tax=Ceratodon purpureus TaxID=3225 RepID=A0A8T0HEN5_CERPU|nr:hypothetical protein KC19_7G139000 [Ceratodon purpureus]KAG0611414.1 hypothetical protein M758_7G139300 [Ceratodon purpureus]